MPASPFISFGDFCQPPRLLFWPKFASLLFYVVLPFYLKLESKYSKSLIKSQGDLKLLSVYKLLRESLSKILRPKYFFSSDENFVLQYIISIFPSRMLIAFLIFFNTKNNQAHVGYFTPSVSPWNLDINYYSFMVPPLLRILTLTGHV